MNVSKELFQEVLEAVSQWEGKSKKEAEELIQKFFPAKKLVGKRDAANLLNCSPRQVDYLRENYGLPWVRLGEMVKFDTDKLNSWLTAQNFSGPGCVPSLAKKTKEEAA